MSKKFFITSEGATLYVGTAADIRAMYGSMARATRAGRLDMGPAFLGSFPRFNPARAYGLYIGPDGLYQVASADTIAQYLADGALDTAV